MQGSLNDIDLRSILQLIELGQWTGELFLEVPGENPGYWFLFFVDGQIVYGTDRHCDHLHRLQGYGRHYGVDLTLEAVALDTLSLNHIPEYAGLWQLLSKNILTPAQAHRIVRAMVEEVLFDVLSLRTGQVVFTRSAPLEPSLTAFPLQPLLHQVGQQLQAWNQLYLHIQSPDQRVAIAEDPALAAQIPPKLSQWFATWGTPDLSLRQIARYLHKDLPTVAHGLYPYIEKGSLQLTFPPSPQTPEPTPWDTLTEHRSIHVVCVDDDWVVGKQVEQFLAPQGYQITLLPDPLQALAQLFALSPDLILCDITMPHLDGYELCRLVKRSRQLQAIPLIMLTGKEAYVDRLLARGAGANDYLTKPFTAEELMSLVESYCLSPSLRHG